MKIKEPNVQIRGGPAVSRGLLEFRRLRKKKKYMLKRPSFSPISGKERSSMKLIILGFVFSPGPFSERKRTDFLRKGIGRTAVPSDSFGI